MVGSYVESLAVSRPLGSRPAFLGVKLISEDLGEAKAYEGSRLHSLLARRELDGEPIFLNFTHSPEALLRAFTGEGISVRWDLFPPRIEEAHLVVMAELESYEEGNPAKMLLRLGEEWVDESSAFPLTRATGLVAEILIELSRLNFGDREEREELLAILKRRLRRVTDSKEIFELLEKAEERVRENWRR